MANSNPVSDGSVSSRLSGSKQREHSQGLLVATALLFVLAALVRILNLEADAYPRLSWSSALLTDEGFYIHNARNLALFGKESTDQFNNALIMPALHVVQVIVFHVAGVGAVQARMISVVASLLMLALFWDALRHVFGSTVAGVATLFLGLDHIHFLYNRMALMDTPATFVLVAAYWVFVRYVRSREAVPPWQPTWFAVMGMVMVLAYATRGLCALIWSVPILALRSWRDHKKAFIAYGAAIAVAIALYMLIWWLPHATELQRVNRYYLNNQLVPHRVSTLWYNLHRAIFGNQYGIFSYLWRHSPVWFGLALLFLFGQCPAREPLDRGGIGRACTRYLVFWLLIVWVFLIVVNYSPSRYYVLFYPPMAAIAAIGLADLPRYAVSILRTRWKRSLFGAFTVYHLLLIVHNIGLPLSMGWSLVIAGIAGIGLAVAPVRTFPELQAGGIRSVLAVTIGIWACINLGWCEDWWGHLSYRQRDADRWLARNLPVGSTLFGDVAPGLCLNNRFQAVTVLPGLCNDDHPIEKFGGASNYIVVLDGKWRERWTAGYAGQITPSHRVHQFYGVLRPFFVIGVYRVKP